jgi:hypothetical protein
VARLEMFYEVERALTKDILKVGDLHKIFHANKGRHACTSGISKGSTREVVKITKYLGTK